MCTKQNDKECAAGLYNIPIKFQSDFFFLGCYLFLLSTLLKENDFFFIIILGIKFMGEKFFNKFYSQCLKVSKSLKSSKNYIFFRFTTHVRIYRIKTVLHIPENIKLKSEINFCIIKLIYIFI